MNMRFRTLAVVLAGALPATSLAQGDISRLYSRPSAISPSMTLGYVGGAYTSRPETAPLEATRRDVAILAKPAPFFMRSRGQVSRYNRGMPTVALGLQDSPFGALPTSIYQTFNSSQTFYLSGLAAAQDLSVRPAAVDYLPAIDGHLYTPQTKQERVDVMFQLRPVPKGEPGPELKKTPDALTDFVDARVRLAEQIGRELFKTSTVQMRDRETGTYADCSDCSAKQGQAVRRLKMVMDLDPNACDALFVLVHAHLELNHILQAGEVLLEAVRRDPSVLARMQGPALDALFGDVKSPGGTSAVLVNQLRRHRRAQEQEKDILLSRVISVYCAWRLGERGEASELLAEMEAEARKGGHRADQTLAFAAAIRRVMDQAAP